jgi:hypothetical protein
VAEFTLTKGANAELPAYAYVTGHIDAVFDWRRRGDRSVDLSAILVSGDKVRSDADFVFL